jgi:hypothetical protein
MPRGPRQLLEERISQISGELDTLFESSRVDASRELAEQLNQAVRRLRIAPDAGELCATLAGAAERFATGSALFRIEGDQAVSERISIALSAAPALAAAAASRDPQIAAATPGEVSAELAAMFEHAPETRAYVFPLDIRDQVPALIYCWGTVQAAGIELLAQVASAVWSALPEPVPLRLPEVEAPAQLVTIALAAAPKPAAFSWDALPSGEQQLHLRAQRFARLKASEIRLYQADLVQSGRNHRNLYELLRQPIDAARETFQTQFFAPCGSMVDYLHLELIRTLANDDTDLLGSTYPGPLV